MRSLHIDLTRAWAIVVVTLYHLSTYIGLPSWGWHGFEFNRLIRLGYVGVEVFFVLSGYCMALSLAKAAAAGGVDYRRYLASRLWRILPAYYVAIAVWCFLEAKVNLGGIRTSAGIVDVVTHMVFVHNLHPSTFYTVSGVLWFMGPQVQFYAVMPLLFLAARKRPWLTLLAAAVLSWWVNVYGRRYVPHPQILTYSVLSYVPLVIWGMLLARYRDTLRGWFRRWWVVMAWLAVVVGLSLWSPFFSRLHVRSHKVYDIVLGGLLSLMVIALDRNWSKGWRTLFEPLAILGAASYSIYLYNHVMYITTNPLMRGWWGYTYYFLLTVLFGCMMYILVEKPALQWRERVMGRGGA